MKCNPLRWLWGILLIAGLLGIMHWQAVPASIQADLQARTQAALGEAGQDWATVSFSGRDAVVRGMAFEEKDPRRAIDTTRGTWGVRIVDNRTELIEEQANYIWTAALRDNRLKLSGFAPNEATRKAIVGAAKATMPQLEIDDRLKLARGAPNTDLWLAAVSFSLKQLGELKNGSRVDIDAGGLSLEGEAQDFPSYRNLKTALANNLPNGLKLKSDKVTAPPAKPYQLVARLTSNRLDLVGSMPSEAAHAEVLALIGGEIGTRSLPINERIQVASGEPKDFTRMAAAGLKTLLSLEEGTLEIKDEQLTLSGLAAKEESVEGLRRTLRGSLPSSVKINDQIRFREPAIKAISPYTTGASIEGDNLVLTGHAPSEEARAMLTAAAQSRFPSLKVADRLQLGAGAPEGWNSCLQTGLAGLARLGNGRLELINSALTIAGSAEDEDLAQSVSTGTRTALGRACEPQFALAVNAPPEPQLEWRAALGAGELVFDGQVPDESAKAELASAAARLFPNAKVVDRTGVQTGSSRNWIRTSRAGLAALGRLRSGEARISGLQLTVSGEARDADGAAAARQDLRDMPKGYSAQDVIQIRTDAAIKAEDEARQAVEAAARAAAEEARRADAARVAEEEKRRAAEEAARQTKLAALPPQKRAEVDRCQGLISSVAKEGVINFDRASAELERESLPTLAKLAEVANTCPQLRIDIRGHTDAEGTPERNQGLSERRAQAVVQYLTGNGVALDRLTSVGYGANRPVASNDTSESRAKNRRIEFIVRPE